MVLEKKIWALDIIIEVANYFVQWFYWLLLLAFLANKTKTSQTLMAHACNPSYSGGRHQENLALKSVHAKGLVEWFKV
jgi:hypothetical protein